MDLLMDLAAGQGTDRNRQRAGRSDEEETENGNIYFCKLSMPVLTFTVLQGGMREPCPPQKTSRDRVVGHDMIDETICVCRNLSTNGLSSTATPSRYSSRMKIFCGSSVPSFLLTFLIVNAWRFPVSASEI